MRTIRICAYICLVKERLNLTIDGVLLEAMKAYAASKDISVSELVESYFRSVTKPVGRDNILDLVDRLEPPEEKGEEKFPKWKLLAAANQARVTAEPVKEGGGATAVVMAVKGGGGYGF
jgi:hypothetical protein